MKLKVRTGPRRAVFGVRPNEAYYEEKRQIGKKMTTSFPFTGGEQYVTFRTMSKIISFEYFVML
jgi:hypothetical protein